jgi:hypothetical protein
MVLQQVLQELESSRGSASFDDLSRKLGIERSALEGMIGFLVRKGRLSDDDVAMLKDDVAMLTGNVAAAAEYSPMMASCVGVRCPSSCWRAESCSAEPMSCGSIPRIAQRRKAGKHR